MNDKTCVIDKFPHTSKYGTEYGWHDEGSILVVWAGHRVSKTDLVNAKNNGFVSQSEYEAIRHLDYHEAGKKDITIMRLLAKRLKVEIKINAVKPSDAIAICTREGHLRYK